MSCTFCSFYRYSQFHPLCFSLAYSGVLVWRNNSQQHELQSSNEAVLHEDSSDHMDNVMTAHKDRGRKEGEKKKAHENNVKRKASIWSVCQHLS